MLCSEGKKELKFHGVTLKVLRKNIIKAPS